MLINHITPTITVPKSTVIPKEFVACLIFVLENYRIQSPTGRSFGSPLFSGITALNSNI